MASKLYVDAIKQYAEDERIMTYEELDRAFVQALIDILDEEFLNEVELDDQEFRATIFAYKDAYVDIYNSIG